MAQPTGLSSHFKLENRKQGAVQKYTTYITSIITLLSMVPVTKQKQKRYTYTYRKYAENIITYIYNLCTYKYIYKT